MSSRTPPPTSDPYYDLGQYHWSITTKSQEAQIWFNRGMVWAYGFNHDEGAKCFANAVAHDPTCPMAYWGLAYASGPNYNKPWEMFDQADLKASLQSTHDAAANALRCVENGSRKEQALVRAIQARYQSTHKKDDYSAWHVGYADAMKSVYDEFGDDLDVACLYAESLMILTPWQLWDLKTGKPAEGAKTIEANNVLEQALKSKAAWTHPGLLHYYVHLTEMSPVPEKALVAGDVLRGLIPDAGHLRHMPSHLDLLVGDYRRAIASNAEAIVADEKYVKNVGNRTFYTLYRLHDYHSLIYAAMFAGQATIALETVDEMEKALPESLLRVETPPMADWTEVILSVRSHVLIRFGRWDEIEALSMPEDQTLYSVTTATLYYAKAIALAAQGKVEEATAQRDLFEEAVKRVPKTRMDFPNRCVDILGVAKAMLAGELEYRRGNFEVAFGHLEQAVELDDNLIYSEPWGWLLPTRHAYAALLLEQGHIERAAALYRADLGFDNTLPRARQHPNNVWALHGYHECLRKLNKKDEADLLSLQLKVAIAVADIEINSSCFCRIETDEKMSSNRVGTNGNCCDGK